MKQSFSILCLTCAALWNGVVSTRAQVNVTQHHNHDSRDGLYVDPIFTQPNAASLTRDLGFDYHILISGDRYCVIRSSDRCAAIVECSAVARGTDAITTFHDRRDNTVAKFQKNTQIEENIIDIVLVFHPRFQLAFAASSQTEITPLHP